MQIFLKNFAIMWQKRVREVSEAGSRLTTAVAQLTMAVARCSYWRWHITRLIATNYKNELSQLEKLIFKTR